MSGVGERQREVCTRRVQPSLAAIQLHSFAGKLTLAGNCHSGFEVIIARQGVGTGLRVAVVLNTSIFANSSLTPAGRCSVANVSNRTSAGLDASWAFAPPLVQNNSLCTYDGSLCGELRVTDFTQYVTVNGSGWGIAPFPDVWLVPWCR